MDAADRQRLEQTTRYEPAEVEARVFAEWMEGGYFHPAAEGTPAENFSVAIPPPNVTGALHMGHALNGSMQDALVRLNRMRGANTLWILGTDQWEQIDRWAEPEILRELLHFLVFTREGEPVRDRPGWRHTPIPFAHPASSTAIRADLTGHRDWLTPGVFHYCREQGLYP